MTRDDELPDWDYYARMTEEEIEAKRRAFMGED